MGSLLACLQQLARARSLEAYVEQSDYLETVPDLMMLNCDR